MIDAKTISLVKSLFKEYYSKSDDYMPEGIDKREFGFGDFEKKIAVRHLAFKDSKEFKSYVVSNSPPFISSSTAEYERPAARPMEAKGWLGGELIFDLDASDLKLKCQEQHGKSWVCQECLDAVKEETLHLVEDFLVPDFGFSDSDIKINFSGNRGYHIHVRNNGIMELDSKARRQISEYITGTNIDSESLFELRKGIGDKNKILHGPNPKSGGWGGKIATNLVEALNTGVATLEELGIPKKYAKKLFKDHALVTAGINSGNWDMVNIPNKMEFWKGIIQNMAIKQSDSIDRNVTNDTGHLIRLPNTIHGDTGLVGKKIGSLNELMHFDPMVEAVVFKKGTLKIHVNKAYKFSIGGESFGPYENQDVELPQYAAVYLLLKRTSVLK